MDSPPNTKLQPSAQPLRRRSTLIAAPPRLSTTNNNGSSQTTSNTIATAAPDLAQRCHFEAPTSRLRRCAAIDSFGQRRRLIQSRLDATRSSDIQRELPIRLLQHKRERSAISPFDRDPLLQRATHCGVSGKIKSATRILPSPRHAVRFLLSYLQKPLSTPPKSPRSSPSPLPKNPPVAMQRHSLRSVLAGSHRSKRSSPARP